MTRPAGPRRVPVPQGPRQPIGPSRVWLVEAYGEWAPTMDAKALARRIVWLHETKVRYVVRSYHEGARSATDHTQEIRSLLGQMPRGHGPQSPVIAQFESKVLEVISR